LCQFDKVKYSTTQQAKQPRAIETNLLVEFGRNKWQRIAAAKAAAEPALKKKGRPSKQAKLAPRLVVPAGALTQAEAKSLSPPVPTFGRTFPASSGVESSPLGDISRSWMSHGHRGSAIKVLRELWDRAIALGHCTECQIDGLYDVSSLAEQGASSSSSSGA